MYDVVKLLFIISIVDFVVIQWVCKHEGFMLGLGEIIWNLMKRVQLQ